MKMMMKLKQGLLNKSQNATYSETAVYNTDNIRQLKGQTAAT